MIQRFILGPLENIAQRVRDGERPQQGVRDILAWYGYRRRTRSVVDQIDKDLRSLNLGTIPHFDWTYLDGIVTFMPRVDAIVQDPVEYAAEFQVPTPPTSETPRVKEREFSLSADAVLEKVSTTPIILDPTYRIGRLEMANRPPLSVPPDASVKEAVTIMLKHDYSQLPVMTGERSVKGVFSWKSYGSRRSLGQGCALVREAMEDYRKASVNESIFYVVELMKNHDCVLVEDNSGAITGIITPYDISLTFGQLGEPFLTLGEIENHIRGLIEGHFTKEELAQAKDPLDGGRTIDDVKDLTFGEYVRLLENPSRWDKLSLALDRATFVRDLEEVRRIRNDVMHFDPEGIDDADLKKLRNFVTFLQRIQRLRATS